MKKGLIATIIALGLSLFNLGSAAADVAIFDSDGGGCDICLAEPRPDPVIEIHLDGTGTSWPDRPVGKGFVPGAQVTVSPMVLPAGLAEPRPAPLLPVSISPGPWK